MISQLGRNMHEHAYLVGKTLLWVKKEVGGGNFVEWLEGSVKLFGKRSPQYMMRFAKWCDEQQTLLEYHGHRTKSASGALSPSPKRAPANHHEPADELPNGPIPRENIGAKVTQR